MEYSGTLNRTMPILQCSFWFGALQAIAYHFETI